MGGSTGSSGKVYRGIDLFSLHPKIKIMDKENMDFADEHFDAITMGNVYGYQLDPSKCLSEVARVLKPRGRFVFNTSYNPGNNMLTNRLTADQVAEILKECGFDLIYHTSEDYTEGGASHIWSVQKVDKLKLGQDLLSWGAELKV